MSENTSRNLVADLAASIKHNWAIPALANLDCPPMTYGEMATRIARIHATMAAAGVRPGDKLAICAKNSAQWALTFIASLTYGTVSVPILNEFQPDAIAHLVDHSEAVFLFVDEHIRKNLSINDMPKVEGFFDIDTLRLWKSRSETLTKACESTDTEVGKQYPGGVTPDNFTTHYFLGETTDNLAIINYTSGSTGSPKGVMITYGNLWSNARFATDNIHFYQPGDPMVSMLPLAHMFGMLVELIFPLLKGCDVVFLGKVPSPKILLDAFAKYKPKMVITVPLVIEKIVYNKVFPALEKQPAKTLLKIPGINRLIYNKVRRQMIDAFGGNLVQLIIGGAAISKDVEDFLLKIRFPYTVGYGMTECAPLIAYCRWDSQKQGSCGKIVDRMQARIESAEPATIPGVLWVKGDNVMKGYYKNPEASKGVFDKDGWMDTGDICTLDGDGYLFIRGRNKTMILGPSGQNIYPEEIENKLNHLPFVAESIVVDRDGKLVALVVPDFEAARKAHISKEKLSELIDLNLNTLNRNLPAYSKVSAIEQRSEPFEKTPKQSIRRYLYK